MGCAPGSLEFGKDVPLDHNFPKEEKHTHTYIYAVSPSWESAACFSSPV